MATHSRFGAPLFGVLLACVSFSASVRAATFNADAPSLGAVADGGSGTPPLYGATRNVTFTVSGMTGSLSAVSLSINMSHTWLGDLDVVLSSPGGARSLVIFSRTGATTAGGVGDSSDLITANTLVFTDTASTNWWTAATLATSTAAMPADNYRTTAAGGAGQVNPAPATSLNTAFAGLTAAQMNGTWTLAFRDGSAGDTGSVTAASLTLTSGVAQARHVDFTGDGRADISIVRATGGSVTWWTGDSASTAFTAQAFGISTDYFVPADYDGDGKTDDAVWRPGAAGVAGFWILPSTTGIPYFVQFGQTGDDPTVIGDYDGDGKADIAVYRPGASAGQQSTWYYKGSASGTVVATQWGISGDFPVPGDYDGDGKADFCVQRSAGGGSAVFWIKQSTAGIVSVPWGLGSDFTVPGDYDGDGKTDLCVSRTTGGTRVYWLRRSSNLGTTITNWGVTNDVRTPGDYDGDGKTDIAIWRPSATPGQSAFWIQRSSDGGVTIRQWGQSNDYPVAAWVVH